MAPELEATVQLDEDDLQELAALTKNSDKLATLVSESAQVGPTVGTVRIAKRVSEKIGIDPFSTMLMVNGLVHILRVRDELSATGEEAAKTIFRSLEKLNRADLIEAWKHGQDKIIEALNVLTPEHPIMVSSDVYSEAMSIPNAVLSMEMSTGTRPVFNEAKDRIHFTIINHMLSLEYHEGYRRHKEIHLSLDASDIARLHELCEQAEQAAATLKASITGPSAVPWEDDAEDAD